MSGIGAFQYNCPMAQTRSDIRTRVRDYLHESVENIWDDDHLNRYYLEELRSLPRKGIYLEEIWSDTLDADTDYSNGITVPTGTFKVEAVERNDGTSSEPDWNEIKGVDNYAGAIFLPYTVRTDEQIRMKLKKHFTEVTDDITALDVPDDKTEVLVWGVVVRAYKELVGYFRNSKSWDSVTKPGGVELYSVQAWFRDAKTEYNDAVKLYKTVPRPRDIDLTG